MNEQTWKIGDGIGKDFKLIKIPPLKYKIKKDKSNKTSNSEEIKIDQNIKYKKIGEMLHNNPEGFQALLSHLENKIESCFNTIVPIIFDKKFEQAHSISVLIQAYEELRKLLLASYNFQTKKEN